MIGAFKRMFSMPGVGAEKTAANKAFDSALELGASKIGTRRGAENALAAQGMQTSRQAVLNAMGTTTGWTAAGAAVGSMNLMSQQDSMGSAMSSAGAGAIIGAAVGGNKLIRQLGGGKIVRNNSMRKLEKGVAGTGDLRRINGFKELGKDMMGMNLGPVRSFNSRGITAQAADAIARERLATSVNINNSNKWGGSASPTMQFNGPMSGPQQPVELGRRKFSRASKNSYMRDGGRAMNVGHGVNMSRNARSS